MSVLLLPPIFQFFDNNGDPLANGFVYTYAAGTTTPLSTFTDYTGTIAAPNPIELNSAGRPTSGSGAIWGEGAYKFIVRDANGVQIGDPLDNVTSFTALANSTNAYFQSFSGNGSQTLFTTSNDLGTEEKALMVFVSKGLEEIAVNGTFATDTGWTKGAGWTIAAGVATATGAISTAISQVPVISLVVGQAYAVTYTITRSAGGLIPSLGGQNGTERTASGTYREIIIAAATTPIAFTGNAFTGTLDSVSITRADSQGYDIANPSTYTISGTSLTFATAPAPGTNNIYVFAPSLLLGAASSAASLAQTYAANALASQTAAASSASLAAASIKVKPAVACATTVNITLSGEQTIDAVSTSASRVLVKNQINATQNGVYVSAAGAWSRATDADTWTEIQGQSVFTLGGSANINKTWVNTNEAGGTVGVDNITWTELYSFIADNSVTTAKIIDGAVTGAKLATAIRTGANEKQNFRLTLSTGVPVTTSDVTGATTIFCTPYNGNTIALYDGTNWNLRQSSQFSISLGTLTASLPYDVLCYDNAGVPTLLMAAWTNSTTRNVALSYQDGVLSYSADTTRRYLGTFYTTSTTTTEDSAAKRLLFNYYNDVPRQVAKIETTSSWNYTTATIRQANGSTANQIEIMRGVSEKPVDIQLTAAAANSGGTNPVVWVGIGVDSTTVSSATSGVSTQAITGQAPGVSVHAKYNGYPSVGYHTITWLEQTISGGGTTTFYGTNNQSSAGLQGIVWA